MSNLNRQELDLLNVYLRINDFKLPESELEYVLKYLRKKTFKKGGHILKYLEVERKVAFLIKGAVHQYNLIDGDILTINIALPGTGFNSFVSYVQESPSQQIQEAIKDSTIVYIEKIDLEECLKKCPAFCFIMLKKQENFHLRREKRAFLLQHNRAAKRYQIFMEQELLSFKYLNLVPQKLIASYLGLSPESLSRVKRRYLRTK